VPDLKDGTLAMTIPATPHASALSAGPCPAPAPGLAPRQGAVLAILWDAANPLTAAQISARLPTPGIDHALGQLRDAGLITPVQVGRVRRYRAVLGRDDYLAALITAPVRGGDV
jgi:hypothetical protein